VPFADHNAMLDPACADITGRVLEMIGRFPSLRKQARVRNAIRNGVRYLKQAQEEDGSWYGRWGVNYIYGTWEALKGLMAVGEDPNADYIQRAANFLKKHQNLDGGWGESCGSYDDPACKARGPSTASQTAWAVMGLVAAGEVNSPEVRSGVRCLLDHQTEEGSWDDRYWTGTGFPGVFYLKYHLYQLYFPLFALGEYRNALRGTPTIRHQNQIEVECRVGGDDAARKSPLKALFGLLW
jgi:squalene-hopene/tetraprenyl-beta-curcumene cyclase